MLTFEAREAFYLLCIDLLTPEHQANFKEEPGMDRYVSKYEEDLLAKGEQIGVEKGVDEGKRRKQLEFADRLRQQGLPRELSNTLLGVTEEQYQVIEAERKERKPS